MHGPEPQASRGARGTEAARAKTHQKKWSEGRSPDAKAKRPRSSPEGIVTRTPASASEPSTAQNTRAHEWGHVGGRMLRWPTVVLRERESSE